ncbi:alpha 1 [New Kent County virus]|uniref:Alpha 1 n=1 Tax=New Kent County virus TaxID=2079603 RepID=A0A2K9YNH8_9RHAB|nr:alpha 1 [New Kent County virus]AUW34401.1 alpha 1 [New Kent County virus]
MSKFGLPSLEGIRSTLSEFGNKVVTEARSFQGNLISGVRYFGVICIVILVIFILIKLLPCITGLTNLISSCIKTRKQHSRGFKRTKPYTIEDAV